MLRKLLPILLSAILLLTCVPCVCAEQDEFDRNEIEQYIPSEPLVTEGEFIRIAAEYLPESNLTRYTASLINNPAFSDGSPITAQDLLFSLYVYLDPGYPYFTYMSQLPIEGLESYLLQASEERLTAAAETMSAIDEAGADHIWSADDPWTEELQSAYWAIYSDYAAACEEEFLHCAQAIVDYCSVNMLETDSRGAFARTSDEISESDGLTVAYAMVQWGYATAEESTLTGKRSGFVWNLDEAHPTLSDFVNELSIAYDGDLDACWAIETTGTYTPVLPDVEGSFIAVCLGDEKDSIPSISGIRMIDETTLEIDLTGIDIQEANALFGLPILSLTVCGDADQWSPKTGLYGHPFGEVSDCDLFDGPLLLENTPEIIF